MPDGSTTEDTLRVMEVCGKARTQATCREKLLDEKSLAFGFNKDDADS